MSPSTAVTPVSLPLSLPEAGARARRWKKLLASALLAGITAGTYAPVLHLPFINFDDPLYVVGNPQVRAGLSWQGLRWALTTTACSNWHPLTWLSLQLDATLFGPDNAAGFHAVNLFWHIFNTVTLFLLLDCWTGRLGRSFLVAALFALHPLHVESVAWVAERKDVLSTALGLLVLGAYTGYVQRPGRGRYTLVCLLLALGLMAKPMLVTWPCLLLLLDYWPLGRWPCAGALRPASWSRLLCEKLPLLALAAGSCVITFWVQHAGRAVASLRVYSLPVRLGNALWSYLVYLRQAFAPVDLALYYPHPGEIPWPLVVLAGGGLLLLTSAFLLLGRRRPWLVVGWLWYLGTLVPVVGLVQVGGQAHADRYTYFPLVGFFLAVVWQADEGLRRLLASGGQDSPPRLRLVQGLAMGVLLLAGVLSTRQQLTYWQNDITLWERALAVTPRNDVACFQLGMAFLQRGRLGTAEKWLRQALHINDRFADAYGLLGMVLGLRGQWSEAIDQLEKALTLDPGQALVWNNLGMIYALLGDWRQARQYCQQALQRDNQQPLIYYNLALCCQELGESAEAQQYYARAVALQPDGPARAAQQAWELATAPQPDEASSRLALLLAKQACGATGEQVPQYLEALAAALANRGQFSQAVQKQRRALELLPPTTPAPQRQEMRQRLRLYEQRLPFRRDLSSSP
jgi:tetratricopeptide (TPR) repeat protein